MSVDYKAIEGRRQREVLALSELNRLEAVAKFPLAVADMAQDLGKLLQIRKHTAKEDPADLAIEYCRYAEKQIRDEFFKTFGHDMIQEPNQQGD